MYIYILLINKHLCLCILVSDIPETYHITGDTGGLTRQRRPNILGQYDLVATSYRNISVLVYMKNTTTKYERVYWMFNVTDSGDWVVGYSHQEVILRATVPGHGFHAPSGNWKHNIETADQSWHLVNDTSLTVRADIGEDFLQSINVYLFFFHFQDCLWSSWDESGCSKECGGGYKNITRYVIKRAIKHGECPGESWRVEHCNETLCPEQIFLIGAVTIIIALIILAAIFHRRKAKPMLDKVSISMQKLRSLDNS